MFNGGMKMVVFDYVVGCMKCYLFRVNIIYNGRGVDHMVSPKHKINLSIY